MILVFVPQPSTMTALRGAFFERVWYASQPTATHCSRAQPDTCNRPRPRHMHALRVRCACGTPPPLRPRGWGASYWVPSRIHSDVDFNPGWVHLRSGSVEEGGGKAFWGWLEIKAAYGDLNQSAVIVPYIRKLFR